MNRRRIRRRASDIAQVNPRRGLTSFILFGIALAIILIYQFSVSEDAADVFGDIVGDPEMTMPATVLDQAQETPPVAPKGPEATDAPAPPIAPPQEVLPSTPPEAP